VAITPGQLRQALEDTDLPALASGERTLKALRLTAWTLVLAHHGLPDRRADQRRREGLSLLAQAADIDRAIISRLAARLPPKLRNDPEIATMLKEGRTCPITVLSLGYQAGTDETGPMKAFDFSTATIADRWQRGSRDMQMALRRLEALPPDAALPSFTACEV
jgi:hypothetical protein